MPRGFVIIALAACAGFSSLAGPDDSRPREHPRRGRAAGSRLARRALNRYQNIRSASFQDWDDAGTRAMYITTRFADTPQVHHVCLPGGARRQLTFYRRAGARASRRGPGTTSSSSPWTKEGPRITSSSSRIAPAAKPRRITDGKSRNIAPAWSPSGELLAWSSNARNGRDMDLYLAAPADLHFQRRLKEVSGQWTVADWSPDGSKVVAEEYLSINESYMHVIDIATGQTTTITPRRTDPKAEPVFAGSSPLVQGRQVDLLHHRRGVGVPPAAPVRPGNRNRDGEYYLPNISWDVEEFDLSDDGKTIAAVVNEDGSDVVYTECSVRDSLTAQRVFHGADFGLEVPQELSRAGLHASSARQSSDAYSFDLTFVPGQQLHRWTESETGGLDTSTFAEPALIQYPSLRRPEDPGIRLSTVGRPSSPAAGRS